MKNKIIDKNSLQKIIKIIKERDPVMIIVATYEWREHITKIVDKVINKDSFYRRKIVSITLSN